MCLSSSQFQDYYRYSSILSFLSLFIVFHLLFMSLIYGIHFPQIIPGLSQDNYLKSPQGFETPPWFSAGLLCVGAYLLCQQITDDGWWSGVAALRSSWSSLQEKTLLKRVKEQAHLISPHLGLLCDLTSWKQGWACFRDIFQPSCPMMVGSPFCLLLLWITCPATFLNICHTHPSSLSPSLPLASVHQALPW